MYLVDEIDSSFDNLYCGRSSKLDINGVGAQHWSKKELLRYIISMDLLLDTLYMPFDTFSVRAVDSQK